MQNFQRVLLNTLIANVTTSYLWFALTFWMFLETKSVFANAIIGGSYMFLLAILSLFFGTIVDRNKKKRVMVLSTTVTLVTYAMSGLIYLLVSKGQLTDLTSPYFWLFASIILVGGVVENMRNIALSTTVTLLVPKKDHDKANGMVGSVQGVAFLVTSVFSGLSVGLLGMGWTLFLAIVLTGLALFHLTFVRIPEKDIAHDPELPNKRVDIKASLATVRSIPGLMPLIFFTTFNNLIGGAYMALMDPYGLTLFSVEIWGLVLGISSTGFIIGGIAVAKKGLGRNPLRALLIVNVLIALVGMLFAIRELWLLYAIGMFLYMCAFPVVEAAEQTIIQRVVPFERQGRVFGFAQSIESAAMPLSAFAVGPITQFWIAPYMASESGRDTFRWLLGDGEARAFALVFFAAGFIVFVVALLSFSSRSYRLLSEHYAKS